MSSVTLPRLRTALSLSCVLAVVALQAGEAFADTVAFEHEAFKIEVPTTWRLTKEDGATVRWEFGPAGLPGSVKISIVTHGSTEIAREAMNEALDWTNIFPDEPFWGRRHIATEALVFTEYTRQLVPLAPFEPHRIVSYGGTTLSISALQFTTTVKAVFNSLELRDENGDWHNVVDELPVRSPADDRPSVEIYRTRLRVYPGSDLPTYRYLAIDHDETVAYFVDAVQAPGFGDMLLLPVEFGESDGVQIPIEEHADTIRTWISGPEAESLVHCELQEPCGPCTVFTYEGDGLQTVYDCMWVGGELSVAGYVSENGFVVRMFDDTFQPVE